MLPRSHMNQLAQCKCQAMTSDAYCRAEECHCSNACGGEMSWIEVRHVRSSQFAAGLGPSLDPTSFAPRTFRFHHASSTNHIAFGATFTQQCRRIIPPKVSKTNLSLINAIKSQAACLRRVTPPSPEIPARCTSPLHPVHNKCPPTHKYPRK